MMTDGLDRAHGLLVPALGVICMYIYMYVCIICIPMLLLQHLIYTKIVLKKMATFGVEPFLSEV